MRKVTWILVLLLLAGGTAWFFLRHQPDKQPGTAAAGVAQNNQESGHASGRPGGPPGGAGGPVPVVAATAQKEDVPIYLDGIGTVQAYNTVAVHPQVSGILVTVNFKEGQDVKTGDLLAQIDPRTYQAQLDQATARKATDQAQLNNAKVLLDRDTDLFKRGVLDHQTFDTQRFMVDQLAATVQGDQASIDNAQALFDYARITAPIDGRCGIRQVDQGNYLTPGSTLVVITQLRPISVIFTLPQQNVSDVNQAFGHGQLQVIAVDGYQNTPLEQGTLAVVDNQIDTSTGTFKLKANFDNPDLKLWPGQFVDARLHVSTQKDAILVPASVVQRGPNGTFAYVITPDKTAEVRPVKVGQIDNGKALILDGLQAGEQVVVDGQYKLQPGSKVETVTPGSVSGRQLAQNDQNSGATDTTGRNSEAPARGSETSSSTAAGFRNNTQIPRAGSERPRGDKGGYENGRHAGDHSRGTENRDANSGT